MAADQITQGWITVPIGHGSFVLAQAFHEMKVTHHKLVVFFSPVGPSSSSFFSRTWRRRRWAQVIWMHNPSSSFFQFFQKKKVGHEPPSNGTLLLCVHPIVPYMERWKWTTGPSPLYTLDLLEEPSSSWIKSAPVSRPHTSKKPFEPIIFDKNFPLANFSATTGIFFFWSTYTWCYRRRESNIAILKKKWKKSLLM